MAKNLFAFTAITATLLLVVHVCFFDVSGATETDTKHKPIKPKVKASQRQDVDGKPTEPRTKPGPCMCN